MTASENRTTPLQLIELEETLQLLASGKDQKWRYLAEEGLLQAALSEAVDRAHDPAVPELLNCCWTAISSDEAREAIDAYFAEVNITQRVENAPLVDTARLARNAARLVATAGAAVALRRGLAEGVKALEGVLSWWQRSASEPGVPPALSVSWPQAGSPNLTGLLDELVRMLETLKPGWPLGTLRLWTAHWFRGAPASALEMIVPIAGTRPGGGYVASLHLTALQDLRGEVIEDSDIALRPYGQPLLSALEREVIAEATCSVRWKIIGQDLPDFMPLTGSSLSLATATGVHLLMRNKPFDPGVLILMTRNGRVSEEKRKLEEACERRMRLAGVALDTELTETDIQNFRLRGLEVRKLATLEDAVRLAMGDEAPRRGIAVIARRRGELVPVTIPITVTFSPAEQPSADVVLGDREMTERAQNAVEWAASCMKRFAEGGPLREAFGRSCWRLNAPYGHTRFHLPPGLYESSGALEAGMALAYLAAFFRDLLLHELTLSVSFPETLLLCAAGFSPATNQVNGEPDISDALYQFRFEGAATILYNREQQSQLGSVGPGARVRAIPVDAPEQFVEELLLALVHETRSEAIRLHLARSLMPLMKEWVRLEQAIADAMDSARQRGDRMARLDQEIKMQQARASHVEKTITKVRENLRTRGPLPLRSDILEQLERMEEQIRIPETANEEEDEEFVFVDPDLEARRKRLYWRVAVLLNFNEPQPEDQRQERIAWFKTLANHRYDENLLYMEALEGALNPFGSTLAHGRPEETVDRWMDRLFFLRDTRRRVAEKVESLAHELEALGAATHPESDEEVQAMETLLRIEVFKVEDAWKHLNFLLGREPMQGD